MRIVWLFSYCLALMALGFMGLNAVLNRASVLGAVTILVVCCVVVFCRSRFAGASLGLGVSSLAMTLVVIGVFAGAKITNAGPGFGFLAVLLVFAVVILLGVDTVQTIKAGVVRDTGQRP